MSIISQQSSKVIEEKLSNEAATRNLKTQTESSEIWSLTHTRNEVYLKYLNYEWPVRDLLLKGSSLRGMAQQE